jgi:hypothetical protein
MKTRHLLSLLAILLFAACERDVYDKGDTSYSYMRADIVDAIVGSDKQVQYVLTDDGERMSLTEPYSVSWIQRADTTYRAVMYYNLKSSQAEVFKMQRLSVFQIRPLSYYRYNVKTDPIALESVWLSGDKRYLNLSVILKIGAVDEDAQVHTVAMVCDTIMTDESQVRTCQLRLYHDQGDMPLHYSQRYYFSVPISGLKADSLRLQVNTYDGVVAKGFRL